MALSSRNRATSAAHPLIATVVLLFALAASPAGAAVSLAEGGGFSFASAEGRAGSTVDTRTDSAPGLGDWHTDILTQASSTSGAYGGGRMSMRTNFTPALFEATAQGVGVAYAGGTARGGALSAVFFFVQRVQEFAAVSNLDPGTYASGVNMAFIANLEHGETTVIPLAASAGVSFSQGRLPPGAYIFYLSNRFGPEPGDGDGPLFTTSCFFNDVTNRIIQTQPARQTVVAGSNATFSVGLTNPVPQDAAATSVTTFQWRKGLQNLSDGGRISGVHTSQLTIANAAVTDSGLYDVVVTQDGVEEPSSLVYLTVPSSTTAAPVTGAGAMAIRMEPPSPSPFWHRTQVRFSLPHEAGATLDVLDVSGRLVRRLLPPGTMSAGEHVVDWDGRDERGSGSPAGVYFLRLASGAEQAVRRIVRLGGSR